MAAALRVDPKDYFTPEEWARLSVRSSWRGLALVAHAWIVIFAAMAVAVVWTNPVTFVLAVMKTFPGAEILGVRTIPLAEAPEGTAPPADDERADDDD